MAESIVPPVIVAKNLSYEVYDTLLELESVLSGFDDSERAPQWVFGIRRMVARSLTLADRAHGALLQLPGAIPVPGTYLETQLGPQESE